MAGSATDVLISPVNLFWRIETAETIDCKDLSDPDGTYFTINTAKDAIQNYVWFDLDAGSSDPAPAGLTGIEVDVTSGDSASTIATAVAAALDALGGYEASASGTVVSVNRPSGSVGETTDTADVDAGVIVSICKKGKDFDLGLIQGTVEPSFAPATKDIVAQQTGVTVLGKLLQGFETVEVSTALLESTKSKVIEMFGIYGTKAFTPGGGTEIAGAGTGQIGKNMLIEAARLEFIPVNSVS